MLVLAFSWFLCGQLLPTAGDVLIGFGRLMKARMIQMDVWGELDNANLQLSAGYCFFID